MARKSYVANSRSRAAQVSISKGNLLTFNASAAKELGLTSKLEGQVQPGSKALLEWEDGSDGALEAGVLYVVPCDINVAGAAQFGQRGNAGGAVYTSLRGFNEANGSEFRATYSLPYTVVDGDIRIEFPEECLAATVKAARAKLTGAKAK